VKFERTDSFKSDYKALNKEHRSLFSEAIPLFHDCAEAYVAGVQDPWHPSLRVRPMVDTGGIWEMTWNFRRPDGRATWEWTTINGEAAVRWRRCGGHRIYKNP
jgi:hypothetical protein